MTVHSPWFSLEPYPHISLTDLMERSARHFHDKVALVDMEGRECTFGHAWEASRRMGRFLQDQGLQKGERIAILSANIPEYFVAFYGILHAGGVVTTLNPLYKEREILHQLEDCEATGVFAMRQLLPQVQSIREHLPTLRHIQAIEDVWDLSAEAPPEPQPVDLNPDVDLAALPYSSGTTGLPKGVMLSHYNLTSNIRQTLSTGLITAYGVSLDFLPFFHIYGMTVLLNCGFAAGATQVIMPRFDPQTCLELVQRYKITNLYAVPPALLALANFPDTGRFDISSLHFILSGAAPLPPEVAQRAQQALNTTVLQGYGMTETSPVTNVNPLHRIKDTSVGPPIADTMEKVVSLEDDRELGPNEVGELHMAGPQIMRGYWNRPEETAETITEDGWIRTGDIAQFDDEGYVYIVDRKKELIKYKGYQVPPAELEALLMEHPAVADVAVIPKGDKEGGEIPKAFVVLKQNEEATGDEIMAWVAERVAPYKKVRDLEFVDAIPKSLSGKILRRELVERERAKGAG